MNAYFKDKVAVVTGAASGFGLAMSRRLLRDGVKAVFMADRDEDEAVRRAGELDAVFPGAARAVSVDVTREEKVLDLLRQAVDFAGHLDFVFNNAGRPMTRPTEEISFAEWRKLVDLNLMGVVYGTCGALPLMLAQGSGHIVNMASAGGLLPPPYQAAYAATKSAIITMTRCLHYEYRPRGLDFSVICPSNVRTPIFLREAEELPEFQNLSAAERQVLMDKITPPDAVDLDKAVECIFSGLENKELEIVFPQTVRELDALFHMDRSAFDRWAFALGEERRQAFAADQAELRKK